MASLAMLICNVYLAENVVVFFTNTAPLVLNITNIIMFANPPLWKFRIQAVLHIFISTVTMVNQDHLQSVIQFALDRT